MKEEWQCPYCDKQVLGERAAHCGEVGHAVKVEPQPLAPDIIARRALSRSKVGLPIRDEND